MTLDTRTIDLPTLNESTGNGKPLLTPAAALPFLGHLKVKLTARLGQAEMSVDELLALQSGATIGLDRLLNHPIDLLAEGHVVAQGTLVAVGEHFGLRITSVPQSR